MPLDGTNYVVSDNAVARCLVAASARIHNPADWCQNTGARGSQRCSIAALGEAWLLSGLDSYKRSRNILDRVAQARGYTGILHLNDATDHRTVMAAFREAIEIAGADG